MTQHLGRRRIFHGRGGNDDRRIMFFQFREQHSEFSVAELANGRMTRRGTVRQEVKIRLLGIADNGLAEAQSQGQNIGEAAFARVPKEISQKRITAMRINEQDGLLPDLGQSFRNQIGRASCRERV